MSHYKPYPAYRESGLEWLDRLPVRWSESRIFGHFEETNSRGGSKSELLAVSQAHGVMPQSEYEIMLGRRLSQQTSEDYSNYKRVRKGDLIYNKMRMWQGAIGVAPQDGIVSPAYITFRPRHSHFSDFWAELFRIHPFLVEVNRRSQGICDDQNSCNYDDFRQIVVPVPPSDEQVAIIASLNRITTRIDALISKKTEFIELLTKKRQTLITHAVTKGLNPNVKMKDSGVEWIGEVPENWSMSKLGYEVVECGGKTPSTENPDYWDGDIPWVTPKDMKVDVIIDSIDKITKTAVEECGMSFIQAGSILVVVRGMILAHSFPVAQTANAVTINQDMKALVPGKRLLPTYLKLILQGSKTFVVNVLVAEAAHGTRVLRTDIWRQLPIPLPTINEQQQIIDQVSSITKKFNRVMSLTQHSIDLLRKRRSALITAAVTGQIDLRESV